MRRNAGVGMLRPVVGPSVEPVSLVEAKRHLRVTWDDDDPTISFQIATARRKIEAESRRCLVSQTWDLLLERFPPNYAIEVPRPPLISVGSVKYKDGASGELVTFSPSLYDVVAGVPNHTGLIVSKGRVWPYPVATAPDAVQIRFTAGYGPAGSDVPEPLRAAILLLVGHYFENREEVTNFQAATLPRGVADLVASCSWGYYPR